MQQTDVSFSCVCLVIDHKFRHNIVKVAVDRQCYDEIHCHYQDGPMKE